jgi:hypothetical protein
MDSKKEKLRGLDLPQDSNILDDIPAMSATFPSATEVRLGFKSKERLDQIEKQRSPQTMDVPQLIADITKLRRAAEERAAANRIEWEARRSAEIAEKRQQEHDAAVKLLVLQ